LKRRKPVHVQDIVRSDNRAQARKHHSWPGRRPTGSESKARPLLVVSSDAEIAAGSKLICVAITGQFREPLADDEVALPFHPAGAASSGLTKPSVAKCSWAVTIDKSNVMEHKGFVSKERLTAVLLTIAELERRRKQQSGGTL
jgi:mRNA-degrading endonuclease toxin of MazEF toxin-antitoxin module